MKVRSQTPSDYRSFYLTFLVFLIAVLQVTTCAGQKIVQIETSGRAKTKKFYIGDELDVRLVNEAYYRNSLIMDIDVLANKIDFDFGVVDINEITHVKTPQQRERGKRWSKKLLLSSLSFAILTPIELLRSDDPNWKIIGLGGLLGATGLLSKPLFNTFSHHKMGKRKRVRLLDLSF